MKLSFLIELIIVLNATGLFSFLAPPLGVKIWVITATMIIFLCIYISINILAFIKMFRATRLLKLLFYAIILWPILTILYSKYISLEAILYVVFPFILVSASALHVYRNGISVVPRILFMSILVTGVGVYANIFYPDMFIAVGILADTDIFKAGGRISGFLMQPNALGQSLVVLFIGYLLFHSKSTSVLSTYIVFIFTFVCIFLSGSRSAIVASILAACLFFFNIFRATNKISSLFFKNIIQFLMSTNIAIILIFYFKNNISLLIHSSDLIDRLELLFSGKLTDSDNLTQDGSVATRIEAQSYYWQRLLENPFLGYGIGADIEYRKTPQFFLTSHSDALRLAVEYGIFYSVFFFWLLANVSYSFSRHWPSKPNIGIFFVPLAFLYVFGGNLLDLRIVYILLGMISGSIYFINKKPLISNYYYS